MLKGTMTIEMTDVNTGKTEKVLEHNMVTNAPVSYTHLTPPTIA